MRELWEEVVPQIAEGREKEKHIRNGREVDIQGRLVWGLIGRVVRKKMKSLGRGEKLGWNESRVESTETARGEEGVGCLRSLDCCS